ncbi:MAG: hypothetical protein M3R25_14300, partial [Bacteroidota bacterium]|nr:hypothetical protein [Bacteroidota bacterium]
MLRSFDICQGLIVISLCIFISIPLHSQTLEPVTAIRELKDGYLAIRFPAYQAKIDTLESMIRQSVDPAKKNRLEKVLQEAIEQRDATIKEYTEAFRNEYKFSKVVYFMDYEARNINTTTFKTLDGASLSYEQLTLSPVYILKFERTEESKIDALVVYANNGRIVPKPFPNNFTRGGFNFLFLKLTERTVPQSRVKT